MIRQYSDTAQANNRSENTFLEIYEVLFAFFLCKLQQLKNLKYTKLKIWVVKRLRYKCNDVHTASCSNEVVSPVI